MAIAVEEDGKELTHHCAQVFEYIMQSLASYRAMHHRMQALLKEGLLVGEAGANPPASPLQPSSSASLVASPPAG